MSQAVIVHHLTIPHVAPLHDYVVTLPSETCLTKPCRSAASQLTDMMLLVIWHSALHELATGSWVIRAQLVLRHMHTCCDTLQWLALS